MPTKFKLFMQRKYLSKISCKFENIKRKHITKTYCLVYTCSHWTNLRWNNHPGPLVLLFVTILSKPYVHKKALMNLCLSDKTICQQIRLNKTWQLKNYNSQLDPGALLATIITTTGYNLLLVFKWGFYTYIFCFFCFS